jgi:two-component system LytT family response regulator
MRVLIVGADPTERTTIRQLLCRYDDFELVSEARTGREASAVIASTRPDVLFVDAELPDMNGFELLQRVTGNRKPAVILVASSESFAVKAFEAQALDYLVRPILARRLDVTMARVNERLRTQEPLTTSLRPLDTSPSSLAKHPGDPDRKRPLLIPGGTADVVVDVDDIDWIEADDYCAALHVQGKRRLVRKPLRLLERTLDTALFVRVHRSAIVNLARVRELRHSATGARVVLADGTMIPLSRRRKREVSAALRRFTRER